MTIKTSVITASNDFPQTRDQMLIERLQNIDMLEKKYDNLSNEKRKVMCSIAVSAKRTNLLGNLTLSSCFADILVLARTLSRNTDDVSTGNISRF